MRRLGSILIAVLASMAPSIPALAGNLINLPTAVADASGSPEWILDGGQAPILWDTSDFPISYLINPTEPATGVPLVVAPGRDSEREFEIAIRRSFNHWVHQEVETTSLEAEFLGRTSALPGPVDGVNVVGWGTCPPAALAFNEEIVFGVDARIPGTTETIFALPEPPISVSFFGRTVQTGQIVESDTTICDNRPFATTLADGITVLGTFDLESVATHEQGHFFGLEHSGLISSTMFPIAAITEGDRNDSAGATIEFDEKSVISRAYPSGKFEPDTALRGTVTVGSLHPNLPSPPPFVGIPVEPGSPALGVHVIAVDHDGLVQAGTYTDFDGGFDLEGLSKAGGSFALELDPLDGPTTHLNFGFEHDPLLGTLSYISPQRFDVGSADGSPISLQVEDVIPAERGFIGIGGTIAPAVNVIAIGLIRDNPATPVLEIANQTNIGGIILHRGEQSGGVDPSGAPGIFNDNVTIFNRGPGGGAGIVSLDLGPGVTIVGSPVAFGNFLSFPVQVDSKAKRGLRNLVAVDFLGNRSVLAAAITVE